jgi:Putative auto-transporter adhesin, head GIN domain
MQHDWPAQPLVHRGARLRIMEGMPTKIANVILAAGPVAALALFASVVVADVTGPTVTGNGNVTRETRTVDAFTSIKLRDSLDLEFQAGPKLSVSVSGESNLLPYVTTTVAASALTIAIDSRGARSIRSTKPLRVTVTAPVLVALSTRGSGDASAVGLSGDEFVVSLQGSGDVKLSGSVKQVKLHVIGSGNIDAKDLIAATAAAAVRGSGDIAVHATKAVAASVSGSGDIVIYGAPTTVSRDVKGSGEIHLHQ